MRDKICESTYLDSRSGYETLRTNQISARFFIKNKFKFHAKKICAEFPSMGNEFSFAGKSGTLKILSSTIIIAP